MTKFNHLQFHAFSSTLQTHVQKNVEVIPRGDRGPLLRLDQKVPDVFYPRLAMNCSGPEDRSLPRICVAPTLLGCLIGYFRAVDDILYRTQKDFHNGYYISGLEYDVSLKPNSKLVADADLSQEEWLVAYSKDTREYVPVNFGRIFFNSLTVSPNPRKELNTVTGELIVEITCPDGLWFDQQDILKPGFYRITLDITRLNAPLDGKTPRLSVTRQDDKQIKKISQEEFYSLKRSTAPTLSKEDASVIGRWI